MCNPLSRMACFIFGSFLLFGAEVSQGEILLGNLPGNDATGTAIRGQENPSTITSKAVGLTAPAGGSLSLGEVVLRLDIQDEANEPVVQIYDDLAGVPGSPLRTLGNPPLSVSLGNFTFIASPPLDLLPETTYWIVVWNESAGSDLFRWQASIPSEEPTGIATFVGYLFDFGSPPPSTPSTSFNVFEARTPAEAFFADGFESGDTTAWPLAVPVFP